MKLKTLVLAIASLPAAALAADENLLDEIVVTATRTAQTADETLAPVTVISRKDIERSQAQSVPDLLRGVPGVSIASNGGAGKDTSLYMRGANDDHVLVLIDGLRVGSATKGITAFQDLPLDQVERIEIVRGPRSTLYGSGAIGGVIQIFTRPAGKGLSASVGFGTQDTQRASVGLGGMAGDVSWRLNASHFYTNGFNIQPAHADKDRDGYENNAGSLAMNWKINTDHRLKFDLMQAQGKNEYDSGTRGAHADSTQQVAAVSLDSRLTEHWQSTLRLGQSLDASDSWSSSASTTPSVYNTRRDSLSWQNDFVVGRDILSLGLDAVDDRVSSTIAYSLKSRMETAVFGQYQTSLGGHDLVAGLRYLDNEQFGGHTTGNLDWGYTLNNGLRLRAGYGTAFKAPTFNQLYYPDVGFYKGNPNLQPETSETKEVGLRGKEGAVAWGINLFRTDAENLITGLYPPTNTARARINGGELDVALPVGDWSVRMAVSNAYATDRTTGKHLVKRPEWSGRVDADRSFGKTRFGISVYGQDESFNNTSNSVRLPGFALVDLRLEQPLDKRLSLQARASNLLDEKYETVSGYAAPGRAFFVGLNYRD